MKTLRFLMILPLAALVVLSSAASRPPAPPPVPAEVLETPYLFEVARHLYRWYLDEDDVEKVAASKTFPFWVRALDVDLDEGDKSQFAEVVMPLVGMSVKLKKADYRIEEIGMEVKTDNFKIVNVARVSPPKRPSSDYTVVDVDFKEMREFLFKTRSQVEFPSDELIERLRVALRKELKLDPNKRDPGEHIVHLSPLSPVANELWVYIEKHQMLVRYASDIDLANPAVWEYEDLGVRTYDVYNQVVLSMEEAAGSNAFMTRDQIGRALYNCVVLGKRLVMNNPAPAP